MQQPQIMGIVNITPDSFSDGGLFNEPHVAIDRALQMIGQGADWVDIGGESTRPGATHVPVDMESMRVIPVIREIIEANGEAKISVDTYKSIVARQALHAGARLINDVTAGTHDPEIFEVAVEHNVPIILMHMLGDPQTMQNNPQYDDVVKDVRQYLEQRVDAAHSAGVKTIYVDPGIGFGKTLDHNLALLRHLDAFSDLSDGIVLGISRKRFLGTITGIEDPSQRDQATALMHALLWHVPVHMIRVHDVPMHVQLRALSRSLL